MFENTGCSSDDGASAVIVELRSRFEDNLGRAQGLIEIYRERTRPGSGRTRVAEADLLRAAVVFIHGAVEDLLRTAAEWRLPLAEPEKLKDLKIPLGDEPRDQVATITLKQLAERYRESTVTSLIRASVEAHLDKKSYNNLHEVGQAFAQLGLHWSAWPYKEKATLYAMMARRHQIAHRVDRNPATGAGHHQAVSLSRTTVDGWLETARRFGVFFIEQLERSIGGAT